MMISPNGDKVYRNLQEQVLKNQEDIQYVIDKVTFANLGIRVVSAEPLSSSDSLPLPYDGEYGDAFLVGSDPVNYVLWVWTRDNNEYNGKWFEWGYLMTPSIVPGPQGQPGATGPQGVRGSTWNVGTEDPQVSPEANQDGDCYLNTTTGVVYIYRNGVWNYIGSIKGSQGIKGDTGPTGATGEQGPQGEKGPQGDVGGFINIVGIVPNSDSLPPPESLGNLTFAYLVGTNPYNLYIQVGTSSSSALWTNMGPMNAATLIEEKGQYVGLWNADTKLDVVGAKDILYGNDNNGDPTYYEMSAENLPNAIVQRDSDGNIIAENFKPENDFPENHTPLYVASFVDNYAGDGFAVTSVDELKSALNVPTAPTNFAPNKNGLVPAPTATQYSANYYIKGNGAFGQLIMTYDSVTQTLSITKS